MIEKTKYFSRMTTIYIIISICKHSDFYRHRFSCWFVVRPSYLKVYNIEFSRRQGERRDAGWDVGERKV